VTISGIFMPQKLIGKRNKRFNYSKYQNILFK
jgi:hypothetical protein